METEEIVYIEFDEALWLHFELMWAWHEVHIGVDRRDLIESALARPKQTAFYQDADIVRQAASLCFGLPLAWRKQANGYILDAIFSLDKWHSVRL